MVNDRVGLVKTLEGVYRVVQRAERVFTKLNFAALLTCCHVRNRLMASFNSSIGEERPSSIIPTD